MLQLFQEDETIPIDTVYVFTDGATEGWNGKLGTVTHCGIGVYCKELGIAYAERIKAISNNEAEFHALIKGMELLIEKGTKNAIFNMDSMIVVNRANEKGKKKGRTKNGRMNDFQDIVVCLKRWFDYVDFIWIPREQNIDADKLSKKFIH
jgi:ribonuclease HI